MNSLTWDDEVTLLSSDGYVEDELGQQLPNEKGITIFCSRQPTSRQEFYLAGQSGVEVSETLIVHPYEYHGENALLFNGKRMRVVKTYPLSLEELELTCTESLGDKSG